MAADDLNQMPDNIADLDEDLEWQAEVHSTRSPFDESEDSKFINKIEEEMQKDCADALEGLHDVSRDVEETTTVSKGAKKAKVMVTSFQANTTESFSLGSHPTHSTQDSPQKMASVPFSPRSYPHHREVDVKRKDVSKDLDSHRKLLRDMNENNRKEKKKQTQEKRISM